jgi:RsiW-degrading membrane proteinase PrsW (M82 family)
MSILLYLLAVVPGLLIILFVYFMDKYEKEDLLPIVICFILGILSTLPILQLERMGVARAFDNPMEIVPMLIYAFLFVALIEEGSKFTALMIYPYQKPFFNEPFDGIPLCSGHSYGICHARECIVCFPFQSERLGSKGFHSRSGPCVLCRYTGLFHWKSEV